MSIQFRTNPIGRPCVVGRLCMVLIVCSCLLESIVVAQDVEISSSPNQEVLDIEDPLALSVVRDDCPLNPEDNPAYYRLLDLANQQAPNELTDAAKKFTATRKDLTKLPTFVDMIRNPKAYRGKPVRLKGHVLQTLEFDALENEFGIKKLYESTLFTEDSQSHPATIVFLEKPENLPIGGELIDRVTVSGYFLKVYWYPSSDDRTRKAPLILAKTVSVRPVPSASTGLEGPVVYGAIGIVFAVLILGLILVQRSDRKRVLAAQKKRLDENVPEFDEIPKTQ